MMDLVMQSAWLLLAVAAIALVARCRGPRGCWWLVTAGCVLAAVDEWFDLQSACFRLGKEVAGVALHAFGFDAQRPLAKVALLAAGTCLAVAAVWWAARRDRAFDRHKAIACAGLALALAFVGCRLLPGLVWLFDSALGLAIEAGAWCLVSIGVVGGLRRCDRTV
ncbi:MAG: hypothetical protein ACK5BN_09680 [Planctomycetota bacterium]